MLILLLKCKIVLDKCGYFEEIIKEITKSLPNTRSHLIQSGDRKIGKSDKPVAIFTSIRLLLMQKLEKTSVFCTVLRKFLLQFESCF